jgi:signal transduction histidine kinase/ligand-binding sensor domain-containing protein
MLENLKFEKITDRTPFGYSTAYSIVQDSKGLIWFATDVGLVRYDGHNFRLYDHYSNDLNYPKDSGLKGMIQAENGNLIFLTRYLSHFIEFDLENEEFKFIMPFNDSKTISLFLTRLIEINSSELWIGTFGYGIFRYNLVSKLLSEVAILSQSIEEAPTCRFMNCFLTDKDTGKVYIGSKSEGLVVYDIETELFRIANIYSGISQLGVLVNVIFKDSEGQLWVGQSNGLYLLDRKDCLIRKFSHDENSEDTISGNFVTSICEDNQGLIWIGTKFSGLNCYDKREDRFHRIPLNSHNSIGRFNDSINVLFRDKTNVIWIGNQFGGIGRFNKDEKRFYRLSDSKFPKITEIDVHTIHRDHRDTFWLGTWYDGLYKYSLGKNSQYELTHFKDLENTAILSIIPDSDDRLWIGCNKYGLIRMTIDTNNFEVVEQDLFLNRNNQQFFFTGFIFRDITNPKHLWLAVDNSAMVIFDTEKNKFVENKIINETFESIPVYIIFEDSLKDVWIGTQGSGVFKYVRSTDQLSNFNFDPHNNESISDTLVQVIVEDHEKNLWFGTNSGGICKLDSRTNRFTRVTIPGSMANAMLLDQENNFWISANSLLLKYDIKNDRITSYPGLNDFNTFSSFKSSDGTMYFGGKNGVTYFKPEEITTNPHIPQIALTDFKILHESVKPSHDNPYLKKSITYADEITLTHKENVITFEFASLIYNDPKQNQHAYKMEGFDQDWVYCGTRRSATYTNLDPGEYTFRVKGSNNDGLWNEEGTSIKLKISPPWHKTVLFKGLIGLGALAGLGSFYRKRISRLNEENIQREEFTKKLIESQENERKRVAAELHDSIGQDLLILKNKLLTNIKKTGDEKFIQQLSELSELTSSAIDDVRQISYNLRPYELDRLGLTKTIESMIERANNFTDITFTGILDDIDKMFPPETGINIYRIIQESLNNVIKHSGASKVIVRVTKHSSYIYLSISDNGKGFDMRSHRMSSERNGFGLKGIEERVKLLGGEFDIDSEQGKGTLIEIVIPYVNET